MPDTPQMNEKQRQAHTLWMADASTDQIAEAIGVGSTTIENWRKKFGWPTKAELRASGVIEQDMADAVVDDEITALRAELEQARLRAIAAETELAEVKAAADGNSMVVDISEWVWDSADDVIDLFRTAEERAVNAESDTPVWPARFVDIAYASTARENEIRVRQGMPRRELEGDELGRRITAIAQEILDRRISGGDDNQDRTRGIKMYDPENGYIRQVIIEDQVNNHVGSRNDAVATYTAKGWKFTSPMLCSSYNCYAIAQEGLEGYCSIGHRTNVETGKRNLSGNLERARDLRLPVA